jgi:outer membrane lipoprotein
MNFLMQTYVDPVRRAVFIAAMLGTLMMLLNACTPVISPQLMDQVDRNLTYNVLASQPDESRGKIILLGGTIVQTVPKPKETEIEVVQKQISSCGEPYLTDKSEGRYLVVVDRFLDPAIYRSGRDITVAGEVRGSVLRRLGEIDYRYPVVSASELHLWKEPLPPQTYPYPHYPYGYPYYWRGRPYSGYPY